MMVSSPIVSRTVTFGCWLSSQMSHQTLPKYFLVVRFVGHRVTFMFGRSATVAPLPSSRRLDRAHGEQNSCKNNGFGRKAIAETASPPRSHAEHRQRENFLRTKRISRISSNFSDISTVNQAEVSTVETTTMRSTDASPANKSTTSRTNYLFKPFSTNTPIFNSKERPASSPRNWRTNSTNKSRQTRCSTPKNLPVLNRLFPHRHIFFTITCYSCPHNLRIYERIS